VDLRGGRRADRSEDLRGGHWGAQKVDRSEDPRVVCSAAWMGVRVAWVMEWRLLAAEELLVLQPPGSTA
jgi:hypothetical protein